MTATSPGNVPKKTGRCFLRARLSSRRKNGESPYAFTDSARENGVSGR